MEQYEEPRAAFYGVLGKDPVTGRLQPQYSGFICHLKFYGVSVPVMLIAVVIAWYVMLLYFYMEDHVKSLLNWLMPKEDTMLSALYGQGISLMPTVVYALIILVLNAIYQPLAVFLNRWGNELYILLTYDKRRYCA